MGTVIAKACTTVPLITPRRLVALLSAKVIAASIAKNAPSTVSSPLERLAPS